ncbi:MAG: hypothetical protein JXQ29_16520 [Planctomycetes bacterium]|nr:hypothetical protein [Planctomycetota bacterium]
MKRILERLEDLEALFADHPWPDSLPRIAGELDALAAYAGLTAGAQPDVGVELRTAADLMRQCWALAVQDRARTQVTDKSKATRMWYLFGEIFDRTQDILAAKPPTAPDLLLDALSVVLPWIGSSASVTGVAATHAAAMAGALARLEPVLWDYLAASRESLAPEDAWRWIETKRAIVERVRDLVFTRTSDPAQQASTVLLLYLSVAVSRINRLRKRLAGAAEPAA